jgi:fluoroacetyl-CoA thioesterase
MVDEAMTAAAVGSGAVEGLSTPDLVALMEAAAVAAVTSVLEEGRSTVGTHLDVRHLAPTPVGMRVTARAVLDEVEGGRLRFSVFAEDEAGEIGRGTHERYVIDLGRFAERLRGRSAPSG